MSALRIGAEQFVRDIKSAMDDDSLMAKYRLNSDQLQRIFRQLLDMELVSEEQIKIRAQLSDSQITRAFMEIHGEMRELE
jgi:hypothetical protein